MSPSSKFHRRYDWEEVQLYYDAGHTVRQCVARFGFSKGTWWKAVRRGDVVARPQITPISDFLAKRMLRNGRYLRLRLIDEGLKEPVCDECGISEWLDEPLSLTVHHDNGDRMDNRLGNLKLLCPNCHSQTPNFARRKTARSKAA